MARLPAASAAQAALQRARHVRDAVARALVCEQREDVGAALGWLDAAFEAAGVAAGAQLNAPLEGDPRVGMLLGGRGGGAEMAPNARAGASGQLAGEAGNGDVLPRALAGLLEAALGSALRAAGERAEALYALRDEGAHAHGAPQPPPGGFVEAGACHFVDQDHAASPYHCPEDEAFGTGAPPGAFGGGGVLGSADTSQEESGGGGGASMETEEVAQLEHAPATTFASISGLDALKAELYECVVLPSMWPEAYAAPLRSAAATVLLHGPPGTGKTMLAEAAAHEGGLRLLSVKPSAFFSKYFGDSEKFVRHCFAVARANAPACIFIDEVDAIAGTRGGSNSGEDGASRRVLCELLLQMTDLRREGADSNVVVIAATNDLGALDEAFVRRFDKRLTVPMPDADARAALIEHVLLHGGVAHELLDCDIQALADVTEGYSGSDLRALCRHAAMAPVREVVERDGLLAGGRLAQGGAAIRALLPADFAAARAAVPPSGHAEAAKAATDAEETLAE